MELFLKNDEYYQPIIPIQSRFGVKGIELGEGTYNDPPRCTSSTSKLVLAIEVTKRNKLW